MSSFPEDDYTPHGYLDNPYQAGPWAGFDARGVIRSIEACGYAWYWPRGEARSEAGFRLGLQDDSGRLMTASDFEAAGIQLVSRYHSSRIQTFDFAYRGAEVSIGFLLASRDALLCRAHVRNLPGPATLIAQGLFSVTKGRNGRCGYLPEADGLEFLVDPGPWHVLRSSSRSASHRTSNGGNHDSEDEVVIGAATAADDGRLMGELAVTMNPDASGEAQVWFALGRGSTARDALGEAETALRRPADALEEKLGEDDRFWMRAPRPVGDWPEYWKRGWVYDLETTRLMVRPPAGELDDIWPTWHLFWPRIVLAENALDMMRLAYADPVTAQAALLTAFRTAPRPNVPCMFVNGSLNMVAEGGDACGTSPAWCLPFHCIYLLYLWHPDRDWLKTLYPYLLDYLDWWMENRRDAEGWFGYRCTWESGEDSSPRLDPNQTGHGDIFGKVRPVELQASMAHSAWIAQRLGEELGLGRHELSRWRALYDECVARSRSLWDPASGRFRDAYPADVQPIESRESYWGVPADSSPLQLLPLMYEVASPEQAEELAASLEEYNRAPWTSWASWSLAIVEAARAVGAYDVAGRIAARVLAAVYARVDRRDQAGVGARPGTSAEWWPEDLTESTVLNETYGWGATTATLLLRHVFGFGPAPDTSGVIFELAPSLQPDLIASGSRLGFANLRYRGHRFEIDIIGHTEDRLEVRLSCDAEIDVSVQGSEGEVPVRVSGGSNEFQIRNGHRYRLAVLS